MSTIIDDCDSDRGLHRFDVKRFLVVRPYKPFKSVGQESVIPAVLQESLDAIMSSFYFQDKFAIGEYTHGVERGEGSLNPQDGKNHCAVKVYRPISLSSLLLKTLEILVEVCVRSTLPLDNFSKVQHAYLKGKSGEIALTDVVGNI